MSASLRRLIMKLSKLATAGFASLILLGSFGEAAINSNSAFAQSFDSSQTILAANTVRSGSFITTKKTTTGKARIINENGKHYLELDEFSTGRGPDVKVILHRNNVVPANLKEENYINLAPLQSFNGKQRYAIPSNINVDEFKSVAIWCKKFNITFGFAAL